jgi:hypothetical protein
MVAKMLGDRHLSNPRFDGLGNMGLKPIVGAIDGDFSGSSSGQNAINYLSECNGLRKG